MRDLITITCDESGSEGENVVESHHTVFCHGSTDLSVRAADEVVAHIRSTLGTPAAEIKFGLLAQPRAAELRRELFSEGGPLDGHALMYLVDKKFFAVAKVVDLLIEELTHSMGVDLYGQRDARTMAYTLYMEGPRAFHEAQWRELLRQFNSLMRAKQRKGVKTAVDEFFQTVDELKFVSRRKAVGEILVMLAHTKPFAIEFQEMLKSQQGFGALDPLLAALPETIRIWHGRYARPIAVLHDEQKALDAQIVRQTIGGLRNPLQEFRRFAGPVDIRTITQASSREDSRIMIADLVAGMGRLMGTQALRGEDLASEPLRFVAETSLWADDGSWSTLTGKSAVSD